MRRSSQESLQIMSSERCSAILRSPHEAAVAPAMQAVVDAGFKAIEFTLNTPGALSRIAEFAANDELLVGAGTVLNCEEAEAAVEAGASFLVSPVTDVDVISWCKQNDILAIPGTYTPTEMLLAHRSGAQIVKLFPGPTEGPTFVKSCLGPMPFLRIFPTSGVTEENATAFLAAVAFGVGFVNCLFDPSDMASGNFDAIRERGKRMIATVRSAAN
ncbi:MAG: bifunctional 4-hydroxy-2-oxoglutarate aldolase/2-dehydro-3-deoxy-phosphogluconate aldolase [Planctomycetota bacterium]|jgi:2-dehydro-3-deoxyphosphogluconate aldolase/(4S)-4-hydroxy-2-oxoglutarate aldolase